MKRTDSLKLGSAPKNLFDALSPSSQIGAQNSESYPYHLPPIPDSKFLLAEVLTDALTLAHQKNTGSAMKELDAVAAQFCKEAETLEEMPALYDRVRNMMNRSVNILRHIDNSSMEKARIKHRLDIDGLLQLVEEFVMESCYSSLFYKLVQLQKREDWALRRAVQTIRDVDLPQFGDIYNFEHSRQLVKATRQFELLSHCHTPFAKLKCLLRSAKMLFENAPLKGADLLIPLMLLMVIRSGYGLHYSSSLYYMKHFNFEHDTTTGEYGYILSTFEAVLDYIKTNLGSIQDLSQEQGFFFDLIRKNGTVELDRWFVPKTAVSVGRDWQGNDCGFLAIKAGSLQTLIHLVTKHQYNISEAQNYNLESALHALCYLQDPAACRAIFEYLTKLNLYISEPVDESGNTPLLTAVACGNLELVELLCLQEHFKVDFNHQNKQGMSVFHLVKHKKIAEFLLQKCVNLLESSAINVNLVSEDGLTPLLHQSQIGRLEIVDIFLNYVPPVDPNASDPGKRTCLHLFAFRGYPQLTERILHCKGIQVNLKSLKGNTPLCAASDAGNMDIVRLLLENGADPSIKNSQGKTAADFAKDSQIKNLIQEFTSS